MAAGLLAQLGIPMGDNLDKDNVEDQDFLGHGGVRSLFTESLKQQQRDDYLNNVRALVAKRNGALDIWGWKDPISILYLPQIAGFLINSHFIFVIRDPAAVAMREMLEENVIRKQRLFAFLGQSLGEYRMCVDFLVGQKRPTLLVSYERSLRFPEALAEAVHGFVHPQQRALPQEELAKIASYIVPDRRTGDIAVQVGRDLPNGNAVHTSTSFMAGPLFGEFDKYYLRIDELANRRTDQDYNLKSDRPTNTMADAEFYGWLSKNYIAAAAASNRGDHHSSTTLTCRVLRDLTTRFSIVGLGPVAVNRATEADYSAIAAAPDFLVGCYNILGMAALLTGDPKTACDYFESGFAVARAKLLSIDPARQPTSMNLLWWLAYHCILAAKHAGRAAIVRKIGDAIQAYLDNVREGAEDRLNAAAAREVYERAIRENLIASRKGAQT